MLAWLLNSVVIVVFRELSADEEEKYYKEAYKKFKPSNLKPRVSMCMYTCVYVCVCIPVCMCVYVYLCVCVCMCTHACMCSIQDNVIISYYGACNKEADTSQELPN